MMDIEKVHEKTIDDLIESYSDLMEETDLDEDEIEEVYQRKREELTSDVDDPVRKFIPTICEQEVIQYIRSEYS